MNLQLWQGLIDQWVFGAQSSLGTRGRPRCFSLQPHLAYKKPKNSNFTQPDTCYPHKPIFCRACERMNSIFTNNSSARIDPHMDEQKKVIKLQKSSMIRCTDQKTHMKMENSVQLWLRMKMKTDSCCSSIAPYRICFFVHS